MGKFSVLAPKATTNYITNPSFDKNAEGWVPAWKREATFEDNKLIDATTGADATAGAGAADLTTMGAAAIRGDFGYRMTIPDNDPRYVIYNDPDNEKVVTMEIYLRLKDLTMAVGDAFDSLWANGSGPGGLTFQVITRNVAGQTRIAVNVYNDVPASSQVAVDFDFAEDTLLRIDWMASTAPGANNGFMRVYRNNALEGEVTGIDNDQHDIDSFWSGAIQGLDAGTSGLIDHDNFRWTDTIAPITGVSVERTLEKARFGVSSLKVFTDGDLTNEGPYFRVSSLLGNDGPLAGSIYVRGQAKLRLRLFDGLTGQQSASLPFMSDDKSWYRIDTAGMFGGSDDLRLYIETTEQQQVTFYIDGAQVEPLAEPTTYCDGDQEGCRWEGARHASISTRLANSAAGGEWIDIEDHDQNIYATSLGGLGLPPITQNFQSTAQVAGGSYDNTRINERVATILIHVINKNADGQCGNSLARLHELRQQLIDLFKPDFAPNFPEFILRYTDNNRSLFLKARYDGGLNFDGDVRNKFTNSIPLRIMALDPYWHEDNQEVAILDTEKSNIGTLGIVARKDGEWDTVAQGITPIATQGIFDIEFTPEGVMYIGGVFVADGNGIGMRRLARLSNDYSEFSEVLTGLNGDVNVIKAHPNGKIYIGGAFTGDNDGNTYNRIVEYDPVADTFTALGTGLQTGGGITCFDIDILPNGHLVVVGKFGDAGGVPNTANVARWDLNGSWHSVGGGFALAGALNIYGVLAVSLTEMYIVGNFTSAGSGADHLAIFDGTSWEEWGGGVDAGAATLVQSVEKNPKDGFIYVSGLFTTIDGSTMNNVSKWNGAAFEPLGDGLTIGAGLTASNLSNAFTFDSDGNVYVSGLNIETAGGLVMEFPLAVWNGSAWHNLDAEMPLSLPFALEINSQDDLYLAGGFQDSDAPRVFSEVTLVENKGTAEVFPIITIFGSGRAVWLENQSTRQVAYIDYSVQADEELIIDYRDGEKTVISNYAGSVPNALLPNSDDIELAAGKQDAAFENRISFFMTDEVDPTVQLRYIPRHWAFDGVSRG